MLGRCPCSFPKRVPGHRVKELLNATAVVAADGTATFRALRFTQAGPAGAYSIVFVVDGVESKLYPINVATSVTSVLVEESASRRGSDAKTGAGRRNGGDPAVR